MKAAGASKSMKVMKMKAVRAMPKSGIAAQVAENTGLKKSAVTQVLSSLADIGATEVKKAGSHVVNSFSCTCGSMIRFAMREHFGGTFQLTDSSLCEAMHPEASSSFRAWS